MIDNQLAQIMAARHAYEKSIGRIWKFEAKPRFRPSILSNLWSSLVKCGLLVVFGLIIGLVEVKIAAYTQKLRGRTLQTNLWLLSTLCSSLVMPSFTTDILLMSST